MEALGERLKITREGKNYTIEQIARDTHIAKRYLIALEDEDFAVFPGETYLKGFLRNYAEYLGLDAEEMVNIYKNLKIQEQPMPMEELLEKRSSSFPRVLVGFIFLIIIAAAVALIVFFNLVNTKTSMAQDEQNTAGDIIKGVEYIIEGEVQTELLKENDIIKVPVEDNLIDIVVTKIDNKVLLNTKDKQFEFKQGDSKKIDLDNDNQEDIEIACGKIDSIENDKSISLMFYKITRPASGQELIAAESSLSDSLPEINEAETEAEQTTQEPTVVVAEEDARLITTIEDVEIFSIDFIFRGFCYFRYKIDNGVREWKYFQKGNTYSLAVKDQALIEVSNAGVIDAKIRESDLEFGALGEIAAFLVKRVKEVNSPNFQILAVPVK